MKNSWSYQPLSRQFTGARRGARAAKRLISLVWHHFLVFLLLNHHFPNEPVRGQYLLMTFPVFGFCCFPWLLPSPLVIVKGRQPVCSMCNRFPLPHSLWPGAATFIAQLGFPLCTPLGRAEATREVLTSGNLKPRNKERVTNYLYNEVDRLVTEVLQITLYIKFLCNAKVFLCWLQFSYSNI